MRGIGRFVIAIVQASIIGAMIALPLAASQAPLFNPTSGTLSGLSMVQNQNNANDALATCNAGGSAPGAQFQSGAPSNSDCWDDTSTAGWIKHRIWMNGTFVATAFYDLTNALYTGIVGGGAINSVASAATADLCAVNPAYLNITGTTAITSFGSTCQTGVWKRIQFAGALTLTYNATTLILPTGANIVTAAGDTADVIALGSGNWIVTNYQRATGAALSSVGLNVGASALATSAIAELSTPVNLGMTASVASNALTVNITGANGATPSPGNPVLIPFRSSTLSTGTPVIDTLQGALGITVASGNTMGCANNIACRIWIYLIDNGGTVAMGLMTCSTTGTIFPCGDDQLYNSAAGTSGGSNAGTLYASTGSLSGKAVRIVGYLEATETTAGTWATAPAKLQLLGPGVSRPGQPLQVLFESTGVTLSITPTSTVNQIKFTASINCQVPPSGTTTILFRRGTLQLGSQAFIQNTSGTINTVASATFIDAPATTSAVSYNMSSSGTACSLSGSELIELEEIMGALSPDQVPANDNGVTLAKVG